MKKNPAPTGEEECLMIPDCRDEVMYSPRTVYMKEDKEYSPLLGMGGPGSRCMPQSYGLWGGNEEAWDLLITCLR